MSLLQQIETFRCRLERSAVSHPCANCRTPRALLKSSMSDRWNYMLNWTHRIDSKWRLVRRGCASTVRKGAFYSVSNFCHKINSKFKKVACHFGHNVNAPGHGRHHGVMQCTIIFDRCLCICRRKKLLFNRVLCRVINFSKSQIIVFGNSTLILRGSVVDWLKSLCMLAYLMADGHKVI